MPEQPVDPMSVVLPPHLLPPDPDKPAGLILAAARRLFAEEGFAGTSTRRIAETAGVNLAMVHYYYGSKEALYGRVVAMEFVDLHRIIRESLAADVAPADIVLQMPVFALRLHRDHPLLTRLILREMADGAPRMPRILEELGEIGPLGVGRAMRERLETGRGQGVAEDLPTTHLLAVLFATGNGLQAFAPLIKAVFGLDLADPTTLDELGTTLRTLFQRAIAPADKE